MRHPPAFGDWLLTRVADEGVAGDLTEEYAAGHSRSWYWREVVLAVIVGGVTGIRQHRWRVLWATVAAWTFMTGWGVLATNVWREWHQNEDITMITRWVGYFASGLIVGRYFRFPMVASVLLPLAAGALLRHYDLIVPWMPRPMQPPAWRAVEVASCIVLGAAVGSWRGVGRRWCSAALLVFVVGLASPVSHANAQASSRTVIVRAPAARLVPVTPTSRPFGAANTMQRPIRLDTYGYVEEEFFVSGTANVYDWSADGSLAVRHGGLPYTTRILVRRPADRSRFSGTVLVDFGNRGAGFDTFAVWGQVHQHLLANGHAYVGATVFANNLGALRLFDRERYAGLAYPRPVETCGPARRETWNRPREFFPPADDGVRWDVMSQLGALLKSDDTTRPLAGYRVEHIYASMQSGGDLPTYINAIARNTRLSDGRPVYDAFLIKDSGGPRIPLHDCGQPLPEGDPRRTIRQVGVPVMHVVAQNAVSADARRPDSDEPGDQFRRYELPGASHFDWWQYNYPAIDDLAKAGVPPLSDHWTFPSECRPHHVAMNDFPQPYLFAGAFANLDAWVRYRMAPPRAAVIELHGDSAVTDEFGNARGGVRTPWVDVPAATFHPAMEGGGSTPFRCDDNGYWTPFAWQRLEQVYGRFQTYATRFLAAVDRLAAERWVTPADAQRLKEEFRANHP